MLTPSKTADVDFFAVGQIYQTKENETVLDALHRMFPKGCKTALDVVSGNLTEQTPVGNLEQVEFTVTRRSASESISSRIRAAQFD